MSNYACSWVSGGKITNINALCWTEKMFLLFGEVLDLYIFYAYAMLFLALYLYINNENKLN